MTMLPTFLAGANYVMHSAGWLESGLVSCYEKFIVDIEILRMLQEEFTPLEVDEASLAYGAHQEVGHGGHFLGAEHTLERFRDLLLPAAAVVDRELRAVEVEGRRATRPSAPARSGGATLEEYEQPPIDPDVRGAARGVRRPPPHRARRLRGGDMGGRLAESMGRLGTETAFEVLARAKALEATAAGA